MPDDKKPLPTPPNSPAGRNRRFVDGEESNEELIADKMSMAMAGGKLDEFMSKEIGDNDNARKLASMMMGLSGMSPGGTMPQGATAPPDKQETQEAGNKESTSTPPPEEIMKAAMSGDAKSLSEMLKKEHLRRQGAGEEASGERSAQMQEPADGPAQMAMDPAADTSGEEPQASPASAMEKEVLTKLIKIASANNVSVDWVISRALKLYVRDYEGTGRI